MNAGRWLRQEPIHGFLRERVTWMSRQKDWVFLLRKCLSTADSHHRCRLIIIHSTNLISFPPTHTHTLSLWVGWQHSAPWSIGESVPIVVAGDNWRCTDSSLFIGTFSSYDPFFFFFFEAPSLMALGDSAVSQKLSHCSPGRLSESAVLWHWAGVGPGLGHGLYPLPTGHHRRSNDDGDESHEVWPWSSQIV